MDYTLTEGDRPLSEEAFFGKNVFGDFLEVSYRPEEAQSPSDEERIIQAGVPFGVTTLGGNLVGDPIPWQRRLFLGALRAIVGKAWEKYDLPVEGGIDVGCGPSGMMVQDLMPEECKRHWQQMDVHPSAVATVRRNNPGADVFQGSYLRFGADFPSEFSSVSGLSTLDSTQHMGLALRNICEVLKPGGKFIHVQDVAPTPNIPLQELHETGVRSPYIVNAMGTDMHSVYCYFMQAGVEVERVFTTELFRRRIGRLIEITPGLELLSNTWVTARRALDARTESRYYLHGIVAGGEHLPPDLRHPPIEEASAIVTVAQKR